jgi:CRISPR type I-E-associated protein CasB/Cse2
MALKHEDAGTLAALRRACGQRFVESRNCQSFASISRRPADFLTVTLAAQYPTEAIRTGKHQHKYPYRGSIGAAWARYCREANPEQDPGTFYVQRQKALVRGESPARPPNPHERFRTILDAELEIDGRGELAYRLRGLVRMCVAADVPIDMIQLALDLRAWRTASRNVQERWARAFYGRSQTMESDETQHGSSDVEEAEGQTGDKNVEESHAD